MKLITKIDAMNIVSRMTRGRDNGSSLPVRAWRCDHGMPTERMFLGSDCPSYGAVREGLVSVDDVLLSSDILTVEVEPNVGSLPVDPTQCFALVDVQTLDLLRTAVLLSRVSVETQTAAEEAAKRCGPSLGPAHLPSYWEVITQSGSKVISHEEFVQSSFDTGSFHPLFKESTVFRLPLRYSPEKTDQPADEIPVSVDTLRRWQAAFAEELGAWDINPPLHHVKVSYDEIGEVLSKHGVTNSTSGLGSGE